MFRRTADECFAVNCSRRGPHRFEVTDDGAPELSAYFRRTVPGGTVLCLCRRHRRELMNGLELVPLLTEDEDSTSPDWTALERVVFRIVNHGRSRFTAPLSLAVTLLLTLIWLGLAVDSAIDGDVVPAVVTLALSIVSALVVVAEWRYWRRLVHNRR